jgi:hypothetical protein
MLSQAGGGLLPTAGLTESAPTLPSVLPSFEVELGGATKLAALLDKLGTLAVPDPRPVAHAKSVVEADAALLAILDAFDNSRQKVHAALAIVHEQLEVQRASGELDVSNFSSALCNFDASLSEHAAAAVFIDVELAADAERAREAASGGSRAAAASADGTVDAVPFAVFLHVCEAHGVTNVRTR